MKTIYRIRNLSFLGIIFLGTVLLSNNTFAVEPSFDKNSPIIFIPNIPDKKPLPQDERPDTDLAPGVIFQTKSEALDADITIMADETGLSKDLIKNNISFGHAFYQYANRVRANYPDQVSGVWVVPNSAIGRIRFIGEVPLELLEEVEKRGQSDQIILTGGSSILEKDHYHRVSLVSHTLKDDLKLTNFICGYNMFEDVISIEIMRPKKAIPLNKPNIIEAIRKRAKKSSLGGEAAIFQLEHIKLKEIIGTQQIITPRIHKGGLWSHLLSSTYSPLCTTGWSVLDPSGYDGFITAGHCALPFGGLASYSNSPYDNYQWPVSRTRFVYGSQGDAAFYDAGIIFAFDDFYATAFSLRDTDSVIPTASMLGNGVCFYGRGSNNRTCMHTVIDTNSQAYVGNTLIQNLVRVTNDSSVGKDSGGGWSLGNSAWGVHSSTAFDGTGLFTPLDRIENSLGVAVKY